MGQILIVKRLKIDKPSGIHLDSSDTRPIKATKLALDTIRANEIAIENSKTGKVTAVVAILKVFGDNVRNSRIANLGKLLNKPNERLNSKKKRLNRPLKCHDGLSESVSDTSERLIVKHRDMWAKRSEMLAPLSDLVGECGETKTTRKNKVKKKPWHWDSIHQIRAPQGARAYP